MRGEKGRVTSKNKPLPRHSLLLTCHFSPLFLNRSHCARVSAGRSPGRVSTGTLYLAQKARQSRKRASYCPVSSEITLGTAGFSSRLSAATTDFDPPRSP